MTTRFNAQGITLHNGESLAVHSAEFHYWRSPVAVWPKALASLKEIGVTTISSYVPWSVHEKAKGEYLFSGQLNLKSFMDQVKQAGLYLMLRPGPHINAELTHFGFPERVLADKRVQARSARGTPVWLPAPPNFFPVPSYASAIFQGEVRSWIARFADEVRGHLGEDGALVALQIDNEMQMFWRLAAFDADYHPDALQWWHAFDERTAPTEYRPENMQLILSWLRFKEHYIIRSLRWLRDAFEDAGLGSLARYHNLPPSRVALCNGPEASTAIDGAVGMDFYDLARGYRRVRERALYLSSSTELPFAPELGMGGPAWFPVMDDEDQEAVCLGALAGGVRAFNFYMGVTRERWYGGLVDEEGEPTISAKWVQPLLTTLNRVDFASLRRQAPIALILSRAEERAAIASCAVEGATPCLTEFLDLGPGGHAELARDGSARTHARWMRVLQEALDFAELPYQLIDEGCLHMLQAETRVVILPTLRRVDGAVWGALHALAGTGIQVVIGPDLPSHDELDQELGGDGEAPPRAGLLAQESMGDVQALAADLVDLAGELSDLWIAPGEADVHCTIFATPSGQPRLLFVANQSSLAITARVNVADDCQLEDGISGEFVQSVDGVASVMLGVHRVRVFLVGEEGLV